MVQSAEVCVQVPIAKASQKRFILRNDVREKREFALHTYRRRAFPSSVEMSCVTFLLYFPLNLGYAILTSQFQMQHLFEHKVFLFPPTVKILISELNAHCVHGICTKGSTAPQSFFYN